MSFCPKCGKQLGAGEVCSCQQNAQPVQPQMGTQPQFQGQPQMGAQPQFQSQPQMGQPQFQGQPNMMGGQPVQPQATSPVIADVANLLKGLFKSPVAAVSYFVNNASIASSCIIIAVLAVIAALRELIYMASYNARNPLYSVYEGAEIFTNVLEEMILVIAGAALFAAMIMVLVNTFEKDHKVTYVQALAVASLVNIIYWPAAIIATVIGLIPVAFFGYVGTWLSSFGRGASYALIFIGIKSVERDDNHMPLVYGIAVCVVAVMTTIVGLIF